MTNVINNIGSTKEELSNALALMDDDIKKEWLRVIRVYGPYKFTQNIVDKLKPQYPRIGPHDIQNVFRGVSYNKFFGPLVIRTALQIIKEDFEKRNTTSATAEAHEFMRVYLLGE